jgi:iron(III) transport system substrate-binding protein
MGMQSSVRIFSSTSSRLGILSALATLLVGLAGCWSGSTDEVVVYAALDREFSEPVLHQFQSASGIRVLAKYDVESTKTVQLVEAIRGERSRPRCDLFWNNEILHTLRLEREGLLDVYRSSASQNYPASYQSPTGHWYGFAARARVLIVNTDQVASDQMPASILDLIDPQWKDRVGIAKPFFGTTATHAAVLFAAWGEPRARDFFRLVSQQAEVLSGNKQVATAVGRGQLAFGLTDTDDALIEMESGRPVRIVFPDQQPDGLGTLLIPNTLCRIRGGPHGEAAGRLLDYLLSADVEAQLAAGPSAQIPVQADLSRRSRVMPADPIRWMDVDFSAAADQWETSREVLTELFGS